MISDLTNLVGQFSLPRPPQGGEGRGEGSSLVPHGNIGPSFPSLSSVETLIQPIADVRAYLAIRTPQPNPAAEESLLITLPALLQSEVRALVRACEFCANLVRQKIAVQPAIKATLAVFKKWPWKLKTFRAKFDEWFVKRDWIVLVNRSKAPVSWRSVQDGLPDAFLIYVEQRLARFAREDGKRQAFESIKRQWKTGRDEQGNDAIIPGYADLWSGRDLQNVPAGWSYSNLLRRIKARARFTKSTRALLHEGESAAREFLPQNMGTRRHLRFLEKITFDDIRMDWYVFNPATGQAEELWLLVARDESTAMVLGFVMHLATQRDDGKTHLGARQMKELAAYLLERYPLPPYTVHWIVERGTATLAEAVQAALGELFNNRIKVHYTSMIGGLSPTGYRQKAKGNSRGKASHESHNRLNHTQAAWIPGQMGAHYELRPQDLDARVKECREIHRQFFGPGAPAIPSEAGGPDAVRFPLLTPRQARAALEKIYHEQNERTDHALEGFDEVLEQWDATTSRWSIVGHTTAIFTHSPGGEGRGEGEQSQKPTLRKRMERPTERALRLIRLVEKWDRVSPDIIRTFLDHTQRYVTVKPNGEIDFDHDGESYKFRSPNSGQSGSSVTLALAPGTKCLAYHHSEDPQFLHLTTGDGRILGTWVQCGRGAFLDKEALAQAMRYTAAAAEQVRTIAEELVAPQVFELEAMRQHNAKLAEEFVTVTQPPVAVTQSLAETVVSRVIAQAPRTVKQQAKAEQNFINTEGAAAAADLFD